MTIVVVDPADIREDSELALLGLERMKGKRIEVEADRLYESDDNNRSYFFFKPKNPKIYTRREIGAGFAAHLQGVKDALEELETEEICQGWDLYFATKRYRSFVHNYITPVVELIDAARSLNAQELHVDARHLKLFEEAYELGASPAHTAE